MQAGSGKGSRHRRSDSERTERNRERGNKRKEKRRAAQLELESLRTEISQHQALNQDLREAVAAQHHEILDGIEDSRQAKKCLATQQRVNAAVSDRCAKLQSELALEFQQRKLAEERAATAEFQLADLKRTNRGATGVRLHEFLSTGLPAYPCDGDILPQAVKQPSHQT